MIAIMLRKSGVRIFIRDNAGISCIVTQKDASRMVPDDGPHNNTYPPQSINHKHLVPPI